MKDEIQRHSGEGECFQHYFLKLYFKYFSSNNTDLLKLLQNNPKQLSLSY